MTKRLQVLFDEEEYREIKASADRERMTVAAWVRQALRWARTERSHSMNAKLQAVADATRCSFPTADIDDMLNEIAMGQDLQ